MNIRPLLIAALALTLGVAQAQGKPAAPAVVTPPKVLATPDKPVLINVASLEELMTLPRVGEKTAALIIKNRPYKDAQDLKDKVLGIGPKTWAAMEKLVSFEIPKPKPAPTPAKKK